nr:hypothetical protein Itr_chr09CG04720 [Ipomoea trifida]
MNSYTRSPYVVVIFHLSVFRVGLRFTHADSGFPAGFCQSLFINLQQRPTPRKPKHSDSSKMNDLLADSNFGDIVRTSNTLKSRNHGVSVIQEWKLSNFYKAFSKSRFL